MIRVVYDNNDTKLMQLSNDLNSYCVNESINSDNTDLVDLNNKCLNGGFNSDHIDISDLITMIRVVYC
jgi:hypothetical protein